MSPQLDFKTISLCLRFIIKELYALAEIGDEYSKSKARRCLEVIKKLEAVPELELRFNDTDFPDVKETQGKLIRLARFFRRQPSYS